MVRERNAMVGAMLLASCLGGGVSHLLLGRTAVQAQGAGEVVTARQVNLVDASGQLRAVLAGEDEGGGVTIAFYDAAGQARQTVGLQPDGTPVVRMHGAQGETRLLASVQGTDALLLVGSDRSRQALFGTVQGTPMLSLGDGARSRLSLQLTPAGLPRLALSDAAGEESASLAVGSDDMPQLRVAAGGRTRALLTVAQDATVLNLHDATQARLVVGVADDGDPSVSFLDANGEIVAVLPALVPAP